ncbi:MAG: AbrB/MazE/SpoVT family DNA-binding domain-containing protein [Rhodanobacteraceae bacterium]
MLAKLTAKNQLTLPKAAVEAAGNAEYFEIEARAGRLVLTPVRIQRANAVRAKLAELNLGDDDLAAAVAWVRKAAPTRAERGVAETPARYRRTPKRRKP